MADDPDRRSAPSQGLPPPPGMGRAGLGRAGTGQAGGPPWEGDGRGSDGYDDPFEGDDDPDASPPRGDAVEVPGEPLTIEYEEVRTPPPWLTPLAIAVVSLFAVFVVTRAAVGNDPEQISISQASSGNVPEALVDGSELPEVPAAVTDRFEAPVVGTARVANVPEQVGDQCARPFSEGQLDPVALERINGVLDDGVVTDLRMGPEVVTVLRTGAASSPPAWPDTWVLSCLVRYEDGAWAARPPRLDFAHPGGRGAADSGPGVVARIARVPEDATWAVQERDGWWLAAPAQAGGWMQLVVSSDRASAPLRVVFLDDEGTVVADQTLEPPATVEEEVQEEQSRTGAGRTLTVGAVDEVLAAVEEAPMRACADDVGVCVWLSMVGSELAAHATDGPHHLDVPPFGELGWCPDAGRFQGTVTRSQFTVAGDWRSGIARRGADEYPLRFQSGQVVVDLDRRTAGEAAGDNPRESVLCVFEGDPTGTAPADQDAIAPL